MTYYHLTGMGALGCFFAWELYAAKKSFTWNDTEEAHTAWKASTGLIYPSGDTEEARAYHLWAQWHQQKAPWLTALGHYSEAGAFWFSSKHPPHGAKYPIINHIGSLYLGALPSYHFNVQRFVQDTRHFFATSRIHGVNPRAQQIVSHGFSALCDHYVWGWSRKVQLHIAQDILDTNPRKPTLYLRQNRFQFAYANIVAQTPYYYAGSSTISQKKITNYDTEQKYQMWKKLFLSLTDGLVTVTDETEPLIQGWRPAMEKDRKKQLYKRDHVYYAPSMGGSGIRLAPLLCHELRNIL